MRCTHSIDPFDPVDGRSVLQAFSHCGLTHSQVADDWPIGRHLARIGCFARMPIGKAVPVSQKPVSNLAVGWFQSCGQEWIDGDQVSLIKRFSRRKPLRTGAEPSNEKLGR